MSSDVKFPDIKRFDVKRYQNALYISVLGVKLIETLDTYLKQHYEC